MNSNVLEAVFVNILIPELARWIAGRAASGEPFPTAAEIEAKLHADADRVIAAGRAFLASKGADLG